jgi:hypothetical protein
VIITISPVQLFQAIPEKEFLIYRVVEAVRVNPTLDSEADSKFQLICIDVRVGLHVCNEIGGGEYFCLMYVIYKSETS